MANASSDTDPRSDRRRAREVAQDALLDAAERLAGLEGATNLSLKRVAEEAGVSTMVIYSRFGDRFGLEEALIHRACASLVARIDDAPEASGAAHHVVAEAIRDWAHERPLRFSLLFLTSDLLDPALRSEVREGILAAGRAIERRLGWGGRRGTPRAGSALLAALVGYLGFELRGQTPTSRGEDGYHALVDVLGALND